MDTLDNASPPREEETFKQLNLLELPGSHIVKFHPKREKFNFSQNIHGEYVQLLECYLDISQD